MPRILDLFDSTVRDVSQAIYDSWIVQTSRFAPAPATDPPPAVLHESGQSSANDLVGSGIATTRSFATPVAIPGDDPQSTPEPPQPET